MLSKIQWTGIIVPFAALLLNACTPIELEFDEDLIGSPLKEMTNISEDLEAGKSEVALFDKTAKKIHKFDLKKMKHLEAYEVQDPDENHFVFYASGANYLIDISQNQLSVIQADGDRVENPLRLQGIPASAAYHPKTGIFIAYDSYNNAGILKISPQGEVSAKILLGSEIADGLKIQSGDIDGHGNLIVGLSNESIAKIDLSATLESNSWSYSVYPTTDLFGTLRWIARLPQQEFQVIAHNGYDKVHLIDTSTGTYLDTYEISSGRIYVTSRSLDPHVVIKSDSKYTLIYPQDGVLKKKELFLSEMSMTESYLNIVKGTWSYIHAEKDQEGNVKKEFVKHLMSQAMATANVLSLPDKSTQRIAENFVFSLIPSKLGYAIRQDLEPDNKVELKHFNVRHIKPR